MKKATFQLTKKTIVILVLALAFMIMGIFLTMKVFPSFSITDMFR